jgi:hypothetical protein
MRRNSIPAIGIVMCLLLASGQSARAELVNWSYTWSATPDIVLADPPGTSKIYLGNSAGSALVDTSDPSTDLVATNIYVQSTASPTHPDKFTNVPFTLSLVITDTASGNTNATNPLLFPGVFNGKVSSGSSKVHPTMNSAALVQTVTLGNFTYTVALTTIVNPGPSTGTNKGSIGATAVLKITNVVQRVPEPGAIVLAVLGVGIFWLSLARRRPLFSF